MANVKPKYSKEEFSRRGEEIFQREIRQKVTGEDPQTFVAIDIELGDYELDSEILPAVDRLRERHPEAQIWTRKVGARYAMRLGGRTISAITVCDESTMQSSGGTS